MLKREIEDIKDSYELLIEGIEVFDAKIKENYIPYISIQGEMDKVKKTAEFTEKIESHLKDLEVVKTIWEALIKEELEYNNVADQEDENLEVMEAIERTSWFAEDDFIRIETVRKDGKSSYPNIIPKHIFSEVTLCMVDQFVKYNKTFFKKTGIATLMKDRIIAETNYKKSPSTVVYSIIKVLLKENVLKRNQSSKRIYSLNLEPDDIENWLKANI